MQLCVWCCHLWYWFHIRVYVLYMNRVQQAVMWSIGSTCLWTVLECLSCTRYILNNSCLRTSDTVGSVNFVQTWGELIWNEHETWDTVKSLSHKLERYVCRCQQPTAPLYSFVFFTFSICFELQVSGYMHEYAFSSKPTTLLGTLYILENRKHKSIDMS